MSARTHFRNRKVSWKKTLKGLVRNCLIWVFLGGVWNKSFSYLKLTPWSFAKCKVLCKIKNFKFETKLRLLGYFWTEILKTIVTFEISTLEFAELPSVIPNKKNTKFHINEKNKFGTKIALLGYFWNETWKMCHTRNQHPQFYQNEFLAIIVNIRIRSTFFENPRSAFSEGLGASSGPLYKVCYWELWKFSENLRNTNTSSLWH